MKIQDEIDDVSRQVSLRAWARAVDDYERISKVLERVRSGAPVSMPRIEIRSPVSTADSTRK